MTNFEKKINREMTHEKFREICDHVYGDGANTWSYTYGQVSSWFTWNRDAKGKIASASLFTDGDGKIKKAPPDYTKRGQYYDGPIYDWDHEKFSAEGKYHPKITTDIVFVGMNMSGEGKPHPLPFLFQNARGHRRIVKTFFDTSAEGGYFTDIIKPDKRVNAEIKKSGGSFTNAAHVMRIIKKRPDIRKDHFGLFKKELEFIGAAKPLLIVFGNDAAWLVDKGLEENHLERSWFHEVVKIQHYASYIKGGDEAWKNDTRQKLKPYITIP